MGARGVGFLSTPDRVQVAARWGKKARRQPGGCRQRARVRCLLASFGLKRPELCSGTPLGL